MALTQVYEQIRVTGMAASTQGRGRMLCRLRDQTYAIVYAFLNGANSEIRVSIGEGVGHTWTEEVAAASAGNNLLYPCIAVDSRDNLHVCYEDDTNGRVYYTRRSHLTGTWSAPLDVAGAADCAAPVLAVGKDDEVSIVWVQTLSAISRVRLRQMSYEQVWGIADTIDNPSPANDGHEWPAVAYDTLGNLHIATQSRGYGVNVAVRQIMYLRRNYVGTWETQIQVTDSAAASTYPSIGVDMTNRVHLVALGNGFDQWYASKELNVDYFTAAEDVAGIGASYNPSFSSSQDLALHSASTYLIGGVSWGLEIANRHFTDDRWWGLHAMETSNPPHSDLALSGDPTHPSLLWAMFPHINSIYTNVPLKGTAMAFSDDTTLAVYFHTFSGYGYYSCTPGSCWESCVDDTLTWDNTTEVADHPTIATMPATAIGELSVAINGIVTDDQGTECDVSFEYGRTTTYGTYTDLQHGKVTGDGFSALVTGLLPGTIYHFRARGLWGGQLYYGADQVVTTRSPETVLRIHSDDVTLPPAIVLGL